MPVIRTFAPILAGVGNMKYGEFFFYNFFGGLIWGLGMPLLGYFLGSTIPNIDHYLVPIVLFIVIVSILPPLWHFLKEKHNRDQVKDLVDKLADLVRGKRV